MGDNNLDIDYRLAKLELKNELREELVQIINTKLNKFESKMLKDTIMGIEEEMNVEEIIAEAAKEAIAVSKDPVAPEPAAAVKPAPEPAAAVKPAPEPAAAVKPAPEPAAPEPADAVEPAAVEAATVEAATVEVAAPEPATASGNEIVTDTEPASEVELAQAIANSNATDAILGGSVTRKKRLVFTAGGELKRL